MSMLTKEWWLKVWRLYAKPFALVAIVVCSARSVLADWNDVPTGSMIPTILIGDRIFVNKLAYDLKVPFTLIRLASWSAPKRGEIVVCFSPADGKRLVKRVVGAPGDRISMRDDVLYINDEAATYQPIEGANEDSGQSSPVKRAVETVAGKEHAVQIVPHVPAPRFVPEVTVPEGSYFLMGDNRNVSYDSRFFGPVSMERIVGRASGVAFSVNPDRYYLPRWTRFFHPID